jgi:glycerophosphoryl diester phosphodiesterase
VIGCKAEAAYQNDSRVVRVQAHRGYSARYPENTLLAFAKAIEVGADQIECDVARAADGTIFILHDAGVERTTNGTGQLAELTSQQIMALDAGGWLSPEFSGEKVPTLENALELCKGRARLNIELKTRNHPESWLKQMIEGTLQVIESHSAWNDVMFSSFSLEALAYTKKLCPQAVVGLLDWDLKGTVDKQEYIQDIGGSAWIVHYKMADGMRFAQAHERGLFVICGAGVDEASIAENLPKLIEYGVDYITGNHTGEIVNLILANGMHRVV